MADKSLAVVQRQRLFEVAGIIECVRHALTEQVDQDAVDNALRAASRLTDEVAASLELK